MYKCVPIHQVHTCTCTAYMYCVNNDLQERSGCQRLAINRYSFCPERWFESNVSSSLSPAPYTCKYAHYSTVTATVQNCRYTHIIFDGAHQPPELLLHHWGRYLLCKNNWQSIISNRRYINQWATHNRAWVLSSTTGRLPDNHFKHVYWVLWSLSVLLPMNCAAKIIENAFTCMSVCPFACICQAPYPGNVCHNA